jgi:hypothetical protein
MSTLDELPPDQRAALSLLLRQRKSYGEVAALLGIAEQAVHDRAHAALAVLAPGRARALTPEQRREIGDYLLGQQPGVAERLRTRTLLAADEPARSWAEAIAGELAPLADGHMAEIPAPVASAAGAGAPPPPAKPSAAPSRAPAPAPGPLAASPAPTGSSSSPATSGAPSSRLGGALILGALAVAVAVAVILIVSSGGGGSKKSSTNTAKGSTTAASKKGPTKGPPLALRSPDPTSKSVGVVEVLSEGSKRAFYIDAEHLPATNGFFYAIWLYNSPSSAEALSKAPTVGSNHKLAGGALLPTNAASFHEMLLTRETQAHPSTPGTVVLRGAFSLGS